MALNVGTAKWVVFKDNIYFQIIYFPEQGHESTKGRPYRPPQIEFPSGESGSLAAVHRLENLKIQDNEPEELNELVVHHRLVFFCDFHAASSLKLPWPRE